MVTFYIFYYIQAIFHSSPWSTFQNELEKRLTFTLFISFRAVFFQMFMVGSPLKKDLI